MLSKMIRKLHICTFIAPIVDTTFSDVVFIYTKLCFDPLKRWNLNHALRGFLEHFR